jgi:hypothetical protein
MHTCPDCGLNDQETVFYRKSTHCMVCNEKFCKNAMDLVREHYKPEYPPHIQEYLDKRRERLEAEND